MFHSSASITLSRQLDTGAQQVLTLTHRLEQAQAQAQALNDPLTALFDRRGFENAAADLNAMTAKLTGTSVLLVDRLLQALQ